GLDSHASSNTRAFTLHQLRVREQGLLDQDAQYKAALKDLSIKKSQIESRSAEVADIQEELDKTKSRLQQLNIENQIGGRVSVISHGDLRFQPIDKRRQMIILGAGGGMIFGLGIILLIAYFDQRVKNVADARGRIRGNNRVLGVLPR